VLLALALACGGIDPTPGVYAVTLRAVEVDASCEDPWNVAPPSVDSQEWEVDFLLSTMTVDGVLFGDLEDTAFGCESLLLADTAAGSVAASIALTGTFTADTTFNGRMVTDWSCEGDACPTEPCAVTQLVAGTMDDGG
jgi:hypothetical protein